MNSIDLGLAYKWLKRHDIDGLNGLKDRPRNGRPPEVPEKKLLKIRRELSENPSGWKAIAAGGEQAVSIPELKMAVAKTLSVLIAKLDPNKLQANKDIALDVIRDCVWMGSKLPTNSKLEGMS
jgi:hypothetical protein